MCKCPARGFSVKQQNISIVELLAIHAHDVTGSTASTISFSERLTFQMRTA